MNDHLRKLLPDHLAHLAPALLSDAPVYRMMPGAQCLTGSMVIEADALMLSASATLGQVCDRYAFFIGMEFEAEAGPAYQVVKGIECAQLLLRQLHQWIASVLSPLLWPSGLMLDFDTEEECWLLRPDIAQSTLPLSFQRVDEFFHQQLCPQFLLAVRDLSLRTEPAPPEAAPRWLIEM